MQRRILSLACALLLAAPLSGCFVIDEIDKGSKLMDDHSPKSKDKEDEEEAAASARVAGKKGAIDAYFREEEEEGTTKTFSPGQVNEGIVACKLGGSTQFMTRENCAARGGQSN